MRVRIRASMPTHGPGDRYSRHLLTAGNRQVTDQLLVFRPDLHPAPVNNFLSIISFETTGFLRLLRRYWIHRIAPLISVKRSHELIKFPSRILVE